MSEECTHDCGSCGSDCGERTEPQKVRNANNINVKKVIAVVSGKGGVGKSLVTSMLAVKVAKSGLKTAILMPILQDHQYLSHLVLRKRQPVMRQEQ